MNNQILDLPSVRRSLLIADKTIALAHRTHAAVTSDRAIATYKLIGRTIATTLLLSFASVLLLIDGCKAIHRWTQAHSDFELVINAKVRAVAVKVKGFAKGQRDRALVLVQSTATKLELAARAKVSRLGLLISERAMQTNMEGNNVTH